MVNKLLFFLDKAGDKARYDFLGSEQGIRDWIANLPMAHGGKALREVYQVLLDVGGDDVPWERRYLFNTMLEEPLDFLLNGLRKQFSKNIYPLQAKALQSAELAIHIHAFMLVGYKKILDGWQAENPDGGTSESIGMRLTSPLKRLKQREGEQQAKSALLLAISHCEQIVRIPRLLGLEYPNDLWQEIHTLYSRSERLGWLDEPVSIKFLPKPRSHIQGYKRILLTALLDMQHLSRPELDAILDNLDHWAASAELVHGTVRPIPKGCNFYLRLEEDLPPFPIRAQSKPEEDCVAVRCRLLKTDGVLQEMERIAQQITEHGAESTQIRGESLKVLVRSWWKVPARRQRRHRSEERVEILVGIGAIHRYLFFANVGHQPGEDPDEDVRQEQFYTTGIQSQFIKESKSESIGINDPWEMAERGNDFLDKRMDTRQKEEQRSRIVEYRPVNCRVLDTSSGGYRLSVRQSEVREVRPGDLIAVRGGDSEHWNLGSVRWISPEKKEHLTLGVELLLPRALPVIFRVVGKGEKSYSQPGFLALYERLPVIVLPTIKGLLDRSLEIEYQSRLATIRLSNVTLFATNMFEGRNFSAGAIDVGVPMETLDLDQIAEMLFMNRAKGKAGKQTDDGWKSHFGDVFDSF